MKRRAALGALGTIIAGSALPFARASDLPTPANAIFADTFGGSYRIVVGGLPGGQADRWGRAIALGLEKILSPRTPLRIETVGGQDGVTGANRLQTLMVSDGHTAALLPGESSIAFLTGDPRVHFRPGEWIPILAGLSSGVIVLRGGAGRLAQAAPVRLAAAAPESPDLAAILAFERLGVPISPIFGLRGTTAVARAFGLGEVDAVMLTGEDIPADLASLQAEGGVAICSLGTVDQAGRTVRDPRFANVPTVAELAGIRHAKALSPPLERAFQGVAAASRLDFIMVLPHLTPAASVALWRQAALGAIQGSALQSAATASAISLTVNGAAVALAPIAASPEALLALRQFLFTRFGWRPS
ncbi:MULTISPECIES: hypothetical protein [Acidiphilium]|uniref:Uncharacterized protein n=1 Tax=Acidiphilium multivorum (strain DSM 11245 / JCM 8867 / NBRC 100883 / AIU 301) TaxID=926570 RepID=F0J3I8_ACIMA|nr:MULTISPECIES: hypothetical protein [Acidiphilium]MBS3024393.1 hypothetical protein [Acidiphilium multivorum]MBU6355439.1 hypothetical protein [Rhodospirillales bacterium]EGO96031.1 hypothetical protein APM_1172 [Acidiphilium sp. PM]KDM68654.1 hypothetical protein ACIDI_3c00130 [Acidiphilium sp. JA12-A1]BAJ79844.1 hypothetical protein ACMV_04970 [Acidiphilium multivorum AIU301]